MLLLIPHTHWEGAVFKTREGYLQVGLPNILAALEMLRQHPEYRFVLDQVAYIKPFLERYPNEEASFRQFRSDGRLQVAGATDVMNDNNMPSGESIAHQLLLGKTYFRDEAELRRQHRMGPRHLWTQRTNAADTEVGRTAILLVPARECVASIHLSEFWWEGIDGTRISAFWLPFGYGNFFDVPKSQFEFDEFARQRYAQLERLCERGRNGCSWPEVTSQRRKKTYPQKVAKFNAESPMRHF